MSTFTKKRAYKKRSNKGLNKQEEKEVRKIAKNQIAKRKEFKFCPYWYCYDDHQTYGGFNLPALTAPGICPGINGATNGAVTCMVLQTGHYPTSALNDLTSTIGGSSGSVTGGIGMSRGDSSFTINGDQAYWQSGKLTLQVNATPTSDLDNTNISQVLLPIEFRVLHIRPKPNTPSSVTPSVLASMFLDRVNGKQGLGTTGTTKQIMYDWRPNHYQFEVKSDFRFKLTQPNDPTMPSAAAVSYAPQNSALAQEYASAFPPQKNLNFWLESPKKKIKFTDSDTGLSHYEPTNVQFQEYIVVIACRYGVPTNNYGNPSYTTARSWELRSSGMTKYREA